VPGLLAGGCRDQDDGGEHERDDRDAAHRPRRGARCATTPAAPERVDRILTLTGRGDLRLHTVVDEDTGRTLRTLANRALLVAIGATFLVAALVSRDDSSGDLPGLTLTDIVTYGGLFAGTVLLVRVVAVIRDGTT
jgi:hypothetical protein